MDKKKDFFECQKTVMKEKRFLLQNLCAMNREIHPNTPEESISFPISIIIMHIEKKCLCR